MLIEHERRDHVQISKRSHYISQLRRIETKGFSKNSNRSTIKAEFIQKDPIKTQGLKLPQIVRKTQNVGLLKEPQLKRQKQKKQIENNKIMELIHKEMSIEKKNYFETISSERALIIKNTGRSQLNPVTETSQLKGQKDRGIYTGRQQAMTPPLKVFRIAKTEVNCCLAKTKKKTMKYLQRQESCSPWNYEEQEDHCLQAEEDCIQVEARKPSTAFQFE